MHIFIYVIYRSYTVIKCYNYYNMEVGYEGGGGVRWVQTTLPFEICAPFFKNQKTKIMKNWEKLSESG